MVWFSLRQHPSKASVKVSSRSDLFWLFYKGFSVGLVWFGLVHLGMVWFGLKQHTSEASVKVSSRSNLFWLFYSGFSVGLVWFGLV